ncbi:hypothetical protein ACFE04_023536 [Oxalis oulophora]
MDFQVVILAGGLSKKLVPLVSKDIPKPLLPLANRPVLSYVLEQLEQSNLTDLIVVVEGKDAANCVRAWVSNAYAQRLNVEVAAVPEDVGTAGALRSIAHHLRANDIFVVSGDLVSDVPPGAVAATHRLHDAVVTAMLCSPPVSGHLEAGSSGGKDKTKKKSVHYNIIGLDPTKQFLLYIAAGAEVEKDTRIQKNILRAAGQMEIRADLMDAHMYAFKRSALQDVLDRKDKFVSLRQDVLPYLVRSQLNSEVSLNGATQPEENGNEKDNSQKNQALLSRILANASKPSFHELYKLGTNVIGEANHLSGYSFSAHNNIIDPSAELGSKTTVGPHCMLGESSQMGDKCSVKRSVIGRHCRIDRELGCDESCYH